ncbi:phenylacetate--CoA ligase family protein [Streptomyces canus]|uniref:phenylacetate--CoA ligase family protein n=1 Tax=Streptomyces sp. SAI-144 TaxID=2940544 RepID=UPI0024761F29|nr:AMP-binding protein [Streptomyces sp. SAI-144]MDH6435682.1 phenylacetate-CoA ligase [Streptomyces sp. SAI-144]
MDKRSELIKELTESRRAAFLALGVHTRLPGFIHRSRQVRKRMPFSDATSARTLLNAFLLHAANRAPFYEQALRKRGFDPASPPPLGHWPVLGKSDLRSSFADLIARERGESYVCSGTLVLTRTSGSTGNTVSHLKEERREFLYDTVALNRILHQYGIPRRGEMLDLGLHHRMHPVVDLYMQPPSAYVAWNFSPFQAEHTGDEAGTFVDQARAILHVARPTWIWGIPSRIVQLAHLARQENLTIRPRAVVASYEPLVPADRKLIGEVFACPVFSVYGSSETGQAAWECPRGSFHFPPDNVIAEVVDAQDQPCPPGESGRLLLTGLHWRTMPLVRYDVGDIAAAQDHCACGSDAPSIRRLEGRQASLIATHRGGRRSAYSILNIIDNLGLGQYQVVQDELGSLRLILSPGVALDAGQLAGLQREVERYLEEPCTLTVDHSGDFMLMPSGKKNPVVALDTHGGAADASTITSFGERR